MVVDNAESSKIVNEFLLEKQIVKELLILENVPALNSRKEILAKLAGNRDAQLVKDVVEVVRKDHLLQHAIEYLAGEKVVAKDFGTAMVLQRENEIHDIVTEDGTEFRQGMVSGG